jgi:glycosyltransferase involved in cell wall biosynthesis/ADP-heptose:LPS heptosyltransferase
MRDRGHRVELICPSYSKIYDAARKLGFLVHALPIDRKRWSVIQAMRTLLLTLKPDLVNTHSSTDSWVTAIARLALPHRVAVVRTRHISAPVSKNPVTRWLYRKGADHVVTTGESLRLTLIADLHLRESHLTSVPTGIDPERFSPTDKSQSKRALGFDDNTHIVGIVATLRSWKGHQDLLNAWATLGQQFPNWQLVIVGDGPQREAIETMVQQPALKGRVQCVGQQQHPEHFMAAMDVFCLPSYANEGVPQALLQAMLSALPIVTTPVGAILEAVAHERTALVVAPRDVTAIANALATLMGNPELRERLGTQARTDALAKFTYQSMADRMEAIFKATVGIPLKPSEQARLLPITPQSIVIINVSRIGDTLFATPTIRAIQKRWPNAALTLLGHPKRVEVLEHFPSVAKVASIEKNTAQWQARFGGPSYDLAFVYGGDEALVRYALRAAKYVVAFAQAGQELNQQLNQQLWACVEPAKPHSDHAVDQQLRLPKAMGIAPQSKRLSITLTSEEIDWARSLLNSICTDTPVMWVGLQMVSFVTKSFRNWPKECFLEFALAFRAQHPNAHFLVFGGPEDVHITSWLVDQLHQTDSKLATHFAGTLTLRQTAALMSQLNLYVGIDTGPTHIMSCFDSPMVSLYHSKFPSAVYGPLEHPCCSVIDHPNAGAALEGDSMDAIAVSSVLDACKRVLEAQHN